MKRLLVFAFIILPIALLAVIVHFFFPEFFNREIVQSAPVQSVQQEVQGTGRGMQNMVQSVKSAASSAASVVGKVTDAVREPGLMGCGIDKRGQCYCYDTSGKRMSNVDDKTCRAEVKRIHTR